MDIEGNNYVTKVEDSEGAFSSFISSLKERFNNPFIFSFIVTWVISNWRITLGLLWLEPPAGNLDHEYMIKYIESNICWWNSFILPTIVALAYTFLMPHFKAFISRYSLGVGSKSHSKEIEILKKEPVDFEHLYKLQIDYNIKEKQLADTFRTATETQSQLRQLQNQKEELDNKLIQSGNEINRLNNFVISQNNVNMIGGKWNVFSGHIGKEIANRYIIEIVNNTMYETIDVTKHDRGRIESFFFNREHNSMVFLRMFPNSDRMEFAYVLHANREFTELLGFEYNFESTKNVRFQKTN